MSFSVIFDAADFVWRTFPMFASLINDCSREQLCRVEFADREALEPGFLPTREAVKLRSPAVPQLDVDSVRAALAEQNRGHAEQCSGVAKKRQNMVAAPHERLPRHVDPLFNENGFMSAQSDYRPAHRTPDSQPNCGSGSLLNAT